MFNLLMFRQSPVHYQHHQRLYADQLTFEDIPPKALGGKIRGAHLQKM